MNTKELKFKAEVGNEFNITPERIEHVVTVKMSSSTEDALVFSSPQEWITAFQPAWDKILNTIGENYTKNGDNVHFFLDSQEITMSELLDQLDLDNETPDLSEAFNYELTDEDKEAAGVINTLADELDQEEVGEDACGCIICRMMRDLKANEGEDR